MKSLTAAALCAAALATVSAPAMAQSQGDWTVGFGVANVNPKSSNGTLAGAAASIGDDTRPTLTFEYFVRDNIGIELLLATPFEHDVSLAGAGKVGSVKQLPPTLSVNYHIPTKSAFKPFVGVGLNYTTFFEEASPLGTLSLDDSIGVALNAGVDYQVSDRGALRLNLRWMQIRSDASLNGAGIGEAKIDPVVVGIAYVHRF